MPKRKNTVSFRGGLLVLCLGAGLLLFASYTQSSDLDLHFSREVPSELNSTDLGKQMALLEHWPGWFFSLAEAKLASPEGNDLETPPGLQKLQEGSILNLAIDPKKGPWRRFSLGVKVLHYTPNRELVLEVVKDSSGKLVRLFDRIVWKIELLPLPQSKGTLIRGTATAHTRHWRSRFFGRTAEKILMNQIFYPDLIKFAGNLKPVAIDLSPPR